MDRSQWSVGSVDDGAAFDVKCSLFCIREFMMRILWQILRTGTLGYLAAAALCATVPALAGQPPTILDQEAGEQASDEAAVAAPGVATATAASVTAAQPTAMPPPSWDVPAAPARPAFPWVEWHGYFRFRPDVIGNGHLGLAEVSSTKLKDVITTSSILPPLSLWPQNNDPNINNFSSKVGKSRDETTISGASMRIRLAPTLHLADTVRIKTTIDLFDNHVLGSTPDYAGSLKRPDVPLIAFATSSQPGVVSVQEAYGEWKTLFGLLRIGRQASNWGLGIFANGGGGNGWDHGRPIETYGGALLPHEGTGFEADFASYVDRAAFVTKVGVPYVALFWDWASQGMLARDPSRIDGAARDITDDDDVNQVGLAIFSKPSTEAEVDARKAVLLDRLGSAFDWGLYSVFRWQKSDTSYKGSVPGAMDASDVNSAQLMPRDAWAVAADLWGRYENRMSFGSRLVLEAEAAMLLGNIDHVEPITSKPNTAETARKIQMWGGAFKGAWQNEGITVSLDGGVASGDDTRCFGVYGGGNCGIATADGDPNKVISGFKFHRNYRVDTLLFRDVIGAVTNTWYIKPTFSMNAHPFYATDLLGVDLAVMYAGAMSAEGTPGGGSGLGTEFQARGFLGKKGLFLAEVEFAYLLPGDGLDLKAGWNGVAADKAAEGAWRLLTHLALTF